jgi:two-component system sensor histidine kinase KdpD
MKMETREDSERLFYLGAGPLAAIILGMVLVPVRDFTTASNFTFVFLVLTIAVAELGGRGPAVATALISALSLDFFLTEPYLRLTIAAKHDIIAFAGLAVCGLVAAALGSQRSERTAELKAVRRHLDFVHSALRGLDGAAPLEAQLAAVLHAAREALPLAAAVVRDADGRSIASTDPSDLRRASPETVLEPDALLPAGTSARERERFRPPLPGDGGRIALAAGGRSIGWLEVWGNGKAASLESRRALAGIARLVAVLLARPARAGG